MYYDRMSCEQPDGTWPPFCDNPHPTRNAVHEFMDESTRARWKGEYAVKFTPTIELTIELRTGRVGFARFSDISWGDWNPDSNLLHAVYEVSGGELDEVSQSNSIPIQYEPTSDTGGNIHLGHDSGTTTATRRLYEGSFDKPRVEEGLEQFSAWCEYQRQASKQPTAWVETEVGNVLGDADTCSLVVPAFTNTTAFTFTVTDDTDSVYWTAVETLGQGDPAQMDTEPVYIRPRYTALYDDNTQPTFGPNEFTVAVDVEQEWELAVEDPNRTITGRTTSNSASIWETIRSAFIHEE